MKQRNMFAAAVTITTSLMTAVYLVAAAAGYAALGDQVDLHRLVILSIYISNAIDNFGAPNRAQSKI